MSEEQEEEWFGKKPTKEEAEAIRKIEVKHIHEDRRGTQSTEEIENDELLESARKVAEVGFREEKKTLAVKYPRYASEIRACETPAELYTVYEKIEENEIPKSTPTGSISMNVESAIPSLGDGEKYENARDLLNDSVQKMLYGKTPEICAKYKKRYERLWRTMLANPTFRRLRLKPKGSGQVFKVCPECQSLMEEVKGACPQCGHNMIQGSPKFVQRNPYPSKVVNR